MVAKVVDLKNVEVYYDNLRALGSLTFSVSGGEFLGVVGPNGAGKSTLLKLISGAVRPSAGSVHILGLNTLKKATFNRLRKRIGMLFQHHDFMPDLPFTVKDVALFGRAGLPGLGKKYRKIDIDSAESALEKLKIKEMSSRLYRELSGGEKKKVQLARILAQEPEILLLDEPTAGLDLDWQERLTMIVESIHQKEKKTIIMVTHDVDRLPACCDRVLLLKNGREIARGKPADTFRADKLSELYECRMEVAKRKGRFFAYSVGGEGIK